MGEVMEVVKEVAKEGVTDCSTVSKGSTVSTVSTGVAIAVCLIGQSNVRAHTLAGEAIITSPFYGHFFHLHGHLHHGHHPLS